MKACIKSLRAFGSCVLLLAAVAFAGSAAVAAEEHPAQVLVRETAGEVTNQLRSDPALKQDRAKLTALINDTVLIHFDFQRMSRRVLGKHWRKASDAEQQQFVDAFKALLIQTYSTALAEYSDEEIEFRSPKERKERGEVQVRSRVRRSGAPPIDIKYAMYADGDRWRVFDVVIDGVSLVISYRSTFASEIRKSGMGGLIERLTKRVQQG